MNRLVLLLAVLALAIQWPLWLGHGGWVRVWELQHQLAARRTINAGLHAHNQALVAEIASLRQGSEASEERARGELHMIRADEIFFQFHPATGSGQSAAGSAPVAVSAQAHQLGVE
jgi:cell division protein FtsB